jgi:hypothetical protein
MGASAGVGAGSVVGYGVEAESVRADAARAGRVGDIGSACGASESVVGEVGKVSSNTGDALGIIATNGIREAYGDNSGRVGSVADGGVAGLDRGERRSSPSSSDPHSGYASLRRLLTLFAGGDFASSGEGGGGVIGDGGAVLDRGAFSQAEAATSDEGGCGHSRLSHAAVAA